MTYEYRLRCTVCDAEYSDGVHDTATLLWGSKATNTYKFADGTMHHLKWTRRKQRPDQQPKEIWVHKPKGDNQ
jgi:hypothetical protein